MTCRLFITLSLFLSLISGCSLLSNNENELTQANVDVATTSEQRNSQVSQLNQWHISGKIAFIEPNNRKSANFSWFKQGDNNQQLNLTTYLGINVFKLSSIDNTHTIEADGNTYHGDDLSQLIAQLTNMQLPVEALNFWLKGLAYQSSDIITLQSNQVLPASLTSVFNGQTWQVNYSKYQVIKGHQLATRFTIKQQDLTIIIHINKWAL